MMIANTLIHVERFALKTVLKPNGFVAKIAQRSFGSISTVSATTYSYPSTNKATPFPVQIGVGTIIFQKNYASVADAPTKVRTLDKTIIKKIIEELNSIDKNGDERIDASELKQLLRKHNDSFTDEEIFEMGELFYAGKSGGSVPISNLIEAMDRAIQMEQSGNVDQYKYDSANPLDIGTCGNEYIFYKNHGYTNEEVVGVQQTHIKPDGIRDGLAHNSVKLVRMGFDAATGWNYGKITPDMILNRTIYLETIAAVPGMVAAIVRHFYSLRYFKRDNGMMQMFLDEANNERMHLLTFVRMKDPGFTLRAAVIGGQMIFGSVFLLAYAISPQFCHRFVGYVEEEAVATYTKIIHAIETAPETNELAMWRTQYAPRIARSYWKLGETGTVLDMMYAIRADEAEHRDVNHYCSKYVEGMPNPVYNPEQKLNTMLVKYVRDMMNRYPNNEKDYKPETPTN